MWRRARAGQTLVTRRCQSVSNDSQPRGPRPCLVCLYHPQCCRARLGPRVAELWGPANSSDRLTAQHEGGPGETSTWPRRPSRRPLPSGGRARRARGAMSGAPEAEPPAIPTGPAAPHPQ